MSTPRASLSFDPGPLVEPVDGNAVRAHAQRLAHSGSGSGSGALIPVVIGGAFVLIFGSVFLTVIGTIVGSLGSTGSEAPFLISAFVGVLPTILVLAAAAVVIVLLVRGGRRRKERRYRLDRFATANGMSYLPTLAAPALPGMIFGVGRARSASDLVRGERPRFVEFANYQYTTGSGKNRTTHRWGYVAIKLDVPLPHIVLDATSNNGLFGSNLPATFDKDQRLSLEGDFDRHFSLYCPEGYERDALYLFTPDIMARFIDNAAALDVEIVDDWLFLYGKREFSGLDPATWAWLFSVVGALLDKFAQWARWRDERLRADAAGSAPGAFPRAAGGFAESSSPTAASAGPGALPFAPPGGLLRPPPGVAAPGRRLTRGVSWVSIVAVGGVVLFWLLSQSGVLRLLFFR
ncbi:hypothetical protein NQ152_04520 [Microbacterium sp. zg.B48]|uniref:hypothetical protein n=1 Tax=Microbacterium sp. zg.B48 TaxID=2969408 RepID=UPI00214CFEE4|nr:hypothetical protein [Microbacterium sp. zg.B48]MCR2762768.1 hypothetical protein [Microbacterium sp. zg.B48]